MICNSVHENSFQGSSRLQPQTPSRYVPGNSGLRSSAPVNNRYTERIQEARETINVIIDEMTVKRDSNNDAVNRVATVNNEALQALNGSGAWNQGRNPRPQYRDAQRDNRHERTNSNLYGPEPNGSNGRRTYDEYADNEQFDNTPIAPLSNQRGRNLEQENFELRRALEYQTRENQDLLRRIRMLEAENADLRAQLGLNQSKNVRSTNPNSIYGANSQLHSPRNDLQRPTSSVHQRRPSNTQPNGFGGRGVDFSPINSNEQSESRLLAEL